MIHWQYTKGAYNKTDTNTGTAILYTFIDYYGGITIPSSLTQSMLPKIFIGDKTNRADPSINLREAGHIMVSGNLPQTFSGKVTFNNALATDTVYASNGSSNMLSFSSGSLTLGSSFSYIYIKSSSYISIDTSSNNVFNLYMKCHMSKYLKVGNPSIPSHTTYDDGDLIAKAVYSQGICQAQYFNSTSDRRAKIDIKPINQSVLPLVTNTQLYSFKYKDLDTPSIGIIAQDVQDVKFDNFSLVDNREATGQDMDYMSIHESKLVYILWKAVQEQQAEIEELKRQLKKD